jgi:hypothetical protein
VSLPTSIRSLVSFRDVRLYAPQLQDLPKGLTALTVLTCFTATGVRLQAQSPVVQGLLEGRRAKGCRLELAPEAADDEGAGV